MKVQYILLSLLSWVPFNFYIGISSSVLNNSILESAVVFLFSFTILTSSFIIVIKKYNINKKTVHTFNIISGITLLLLFVIYIIDNANNILIYNFKLNKIIYMTISIILGIMITINTNYILNNINEKGAFILYSNIPSLLIFLLTSLKIKNYNDLVYLLIIITTSIFALITNTIKDKKEYNNSLKECDEQSKDEQSKDEQSEDEQSEDKQSEDEQSEEINPIIINIENNNIYIKHTDIEKNKLLNNNIINELIKNKLILINSFLSYFSMYLIYPSIQMYVYFDIIKINFIDINIITTHLLFSICLLVGNFIGTIFKSKNIIVSICMNIATIIIVLFIAITCKSFINQRRFTLFELNDIIYIILLIISYTYVGVATAHAPNYINSKTNNNLLINGYLFSVQVSVIISSLLSMLLVLIIKKN